MHENVNTETSLYNTRFAALPRLSREKERELFTRWQEHADDAAKQALLSTNLRTVVTIALKYIRYGLPLAELIAVGNLGVLHALTTFDITRGIRFVTHAAYSARAYILNYVMRSWGRVSADSETQRTSLFYRIGRERARMLSLIGEQSAESSQGAGIWTRHSGQQDASPAT